MRITHICIKNYRTIESLDIDLPEYYHALSGANDSGKSNIIRAVGHIFGNDDPLEYALTTRPSLRWTEDYPKWLRGEQSGESIDIHVMLEVQSTRDAGVYNFLQTYLKLDNGEPTLALTVCAKLRKDKPSIIYTLIIGGQEITGDKAQEVIKRLKNAPTMHFHNSTDRPYRPYRFYSGVITEQILKDNVVLKEVSQFVQKKITKVVKDHQERLSQLLGRLQPRYKVGLTLPDYEFSDIPYAISLESSKTTVPLSDWGSGTQNRALILLAIFNALASKDLENTVARVAPIVVIEEPESFLHPSAQAQFGRLLQDLSSELEIQIIVTTHSPLMLSQTSPTSNILVSRHKAQGGAVRGTYRVETSGDKWMLPFGQALGIASEAFVPWKEALFSESHDILLVEGATDKEYLSLLQDAAHGANRLSFNGLIFPYDGADNLRNQTVLRLVQARYSNVIVTFDLDARDRVIETLRILGFEEALDCFAIGQDSAGKRNIEGLLPQEVLEAVYAANTGVVQASLNGSKEERKSAQQRLKVLLLEEFKRVAQPGDEYYSAFYSLARKLNNAIKKASKRERAKANDLVVKTI